tara:strand:+ start:60977 stop:61384 length:408 start_codon:yes stop_codon:yes gene_type:complete
MPIPKLSRGFLDASLTLKTNPLSKDVVTLRNQVAISRSVRNLVLTFTGERFFQPDLGCQVYRLLFENITEIIADQIKDEISRTIARYEPRVELVRNGVSVNPDYEGNAYNVTIKYNIIGVEVTPEELSFVLQSTR